MRSVILIKKAFWGFITLFILYSGVAVGDEQKHWLDEYRNANPDLYNEQGYRKRQYRAPTPESVTGATLIDTEQLQDMLLSSNPPYLVNVLPLKTYENGFVIDKIYTHIASSLWLPNVGRGTITPAMEEWFFAQLNRLTKAEKAAKIVIYCRADCWMSWNAIKRVARSGYTSLYWYRDGLDGWRENALPEVAAEPKSYFSQ